MKHINRSKLLSIAVASAFAAGISAPVAVLAQDDENRVLEEITVTARKREENIQDVALSVSAMGQQEIENSFAADLRDLVSLSPNLVLDDKRAFPEDLTGGRIKASGSHGAEVAVQSSRFGHGRR